MDSVNYLFALWLVADTFSEIRLDVPRCGTSLVHDHWIQRPTILTLLMFPVLVWRYARLAKQEEQEAVAEFGNAYMRSAAQTPAFFPRLVSRAA
jgi:protein-S-isoprenylcysteine O-methyltransferase Ste14